jgi:ATP-dependent helicase/nuclease subunit A
VTRRRDDATEAQVRAADPAGSAWLTANAGSGKTRVLTDRVARLLLRDVDPRQILCLTFTRAAASEMQNRLFARLGEWAMCPDADLRETLLDLGDDVPEDLGRARTLFASAIETPGGLKIQTIHSFCAGILRRFPLEAGVNPQFEEMEDRAAELLRAEIVDQMAGDGDAEAVRALTRHFTGDDFGRLTAEIARHRDSLSAPATWEELANTFGMAPGLTEDAILSSVFVGGEMALLERIIPVMMAKGGNDEKAATLLSGIRVLDRNALSVLDRCFVTQSSGLPKIDSFPTKPTREKIAADMPALNAFIERVHAAREPLCKLAAAQKTHALHQFAAPFLARYGEAKRQRGWLDYDDLILRTRDLLSSPAVADWVLYRLDGGISHILVDEAQDTSPAQWDVIRKLAQEFTAGHGSRPDRLRTVFVVGDRKQSIYSFQGADPDEFDRMEREFATKLDDAGLSLARASLEFSFRSSDAILRVVDRTFAGKAPAGFVAELTHRAFHAEKPGRVDLWPVIEPSVDREDRLWSDPVDRKPSTNHSVLLANQVADRIAAMLDPLQPVLIPDRDTSGGPFRMRPVRAGDIMILMQTRKPLFHEIIRACKARKLPIAGADRLRVGGELAVRDLLALLGFLATPEDSLSLATVLRSPLGGWSEKQLYDLANGRKETHLWETLRARRDAHPETYAMLTDLRGRIDFLRPYDLLERILTRFRGREKLLARLGDRGGGWNGRHPVAGTGLRTQLGTKPERDSCAGQRPIIWRSSGK